MCAKLRNLTLLLLVVTLFSCTSKKDSATELRLISWNCNNFLLSLDTLHAASAFLNSHNPDIICLQERPHTNLVRYDSIKKCFPTLPYKVTNGREDENLNISIFSKYPVSNVKTWYFSDTYNKMIQADINKEIPIPCHCLWGFQRYSIELYSSKPFKSTERFQYNFKRKLPETGRVLQNRLYLSIK